MKCYYHLFFLFFFFFYLSLSIQFESGGELFILNIFLLSQIVWGVFKSIMVGVSTYFSFFLSYIDGTWKFERGLTCDGVSRVMIQNRKVLGERDIQNRDFS